MADASVLDLRLATAIDPANLHPNLAPDPNVVQDPSVYELAGTNWYGQSQDSFTQVPQEQEQSPDTNANAVTEAASPSHVDSDQARLEVARQRRQRAREREEERPGMSALLPDEIPVEPPPDIDETVPIPFTRPCSMARPDIPPGLRCVVMLKPDYNYRMCEGCRMRFKLAEVRAKGIRYDGKKKARATPNESRKQKHKARPQLIRYNGELVLDPAYMHTYNLDPRMFGPEGQLKNMAANEKAQFSQALKNATSALQGSRSKSREASEGVSEQVNTPTEAPVSTSNVAGPSSTPGPSTAAEEPKATANDGLLRVRICSVKTCHAPVPIDYHWKMCESCRVNYRKWGIEKRDRMRERRLKDMPKEERDRYLTLSKGKRAQQDANKTGGPPIIELEVPFDPTIPPRPCSVGNCKNHVPGNSGYKRCPTHRKESRVYASSYQKKRELQMEVYQKALEEGHDPEEALKDYIAQMSKRDDTSDEEDGIDKSQDGEEPKKKRRSKAKKSSDVIDPILLESPFTTSTETVPKRAPMPPPSMRRTGHICSGKNCANLLEQTVLESFSWRLRSLTVIHA
ncbi:hypothetical protein SCHPADRAFT_582635 [Schizopora paradoxa]|uniref:Uncharacterized protein n=1 Tax=Schizopora paradoxa TaxID=27342 RepID=A0A0H2RC69_9AGAM|nr:hypothetical protein SCHPADRAFT_582635 [Schizopora paradoxa]